MQVYLTLCCTLISLAAGAYLHTLLNIGGLLTTFAAIGIVTWILSTPPYEEVMLLCLSSSLFFLFY